MDLIYKVIEDYIDELILKKKNHVQKMENDFNVDLNSRINEKIFKLRRDINVLQVCKYKIREILSFISDVDF